MLALNPRTFGLLPSGYGISPSQGRKIIPVYLDWSKDSRFSIDFLTLQNWEQDFGYVQSLFINALNQAANSMNFYFNNVLVGTVSANSSPVVYPVLNKNPVVYEFRGDEGGTATGSTQLIFCNFPLPLTKL